MSGAYDLQITRDFNNQIHSFDQSIWRKWQRVGKTFYADPFHPSLKTEQIHHAEDGIYSARLDDNYRLIFKLVKPTTIILAWVDTHDKAYAKARRISIVLQSGNVKIIETEQVSRSPSHPEVETIKEFPELLFEKHSDASLLAMGIPREVLPELRKIREINDLEPLENRLPPDLYDKLLNLVWPDTVKQPEVTDEEIKEQIEKDPNQEDLALLDSSDEFERALAGSLQEWMLFLHPSQRQIVEATFGGPARIKGVAGSGKTVVALHRARYLAKAARQGQKVLFLTYSNRLAGVAEELLTLLCGNGAVRAAIEVRTLHSWCRRFLGGEATISSVGDRKAALVQAIQTMCSKYPESRLQQFKQKFIEEEIGAVIQGRALGNREAYLVLKRTGRGVPLSDDDRRVIFRVYEEYKKLLSPKIDFDELVLLTLQEIREEAPNTVYCGVVVDEIQDLTECGMRVIKEIAKPAPHNLLLIGDGQQQIYNAGFSMRETGIEIVGRSRILRRNYRNTKPILEAAYSMIKDMDFDDLGDDAPTKYSPEYAPRDGKRPVLKPCSSLFDEQKWLALELKQVLGTEPRPFLGDIAILGRTEQKLHKFQDFLRTLGFSTCFLSRANVKEYLDNGTIKLVTMHSAKGLEFKIVFLVGMSKDEFPFSTSQANGGMSEDALELEQRLLYVAMTRARDMLYISYCGGPSKFIRQIEPQLVDVRT